MPYFITLHTGKQAPPAGTTDTSFAIPAWEQSLMTSILSAGTFFGQSYFRYIWNSVLTPHKARSWLAISQTTSVGGSPLFLDASSLL